MSSCLQDGAEAGLADQHLPRLAAREVEHLTRHEIVEQDDVGGLQRAHRAQGQQFGIAGAGADQRDRAVLDRAALARHLGDEAIEIGCPPARGRDWPPRER